MMSLAELDQRVRSMSLDFVQIRGHYGPAFAAIERQRGGYRSKASGADTSGGGERTVDVDGDAVPVTSVEAAVLDRRHDPAAAAARRLERMTRDVQRQLGELAKLVEAWYDPNAGDATHQPIPLDNDLCPNHRAHGVYSEMCQRDKRLCRWCENVRNRLGHLPDSVLIDQSERLGRSRLTGREYGAFVKRCEDRKAAERANRPKATSRKRNRKAARRSKGAA